MGQPKPNQRRRLSTRPITKIVAVLLVRAGWAPAFVLLLHIFLSYPVNVYSIHSQSDVPMHFFGGVAVAFFLFSCFAAIPADLIHPKVRPLVQIVFVFSLTATTAVFWEFVEFATDLWLGTHVLGNVDDTLQDLAFGISGASVYLLIAWWRGKLGRVRPID